MTPQRLQRSRAKGSRIPEGTVCVTRPGVYGNPYSVRQHCPGLWGVWCGNVGCGLHQSRREAAQVAVDLYWEWAPEHLDLAHLAERLAGRNVACWCPVEVDGVLWPCHGTGWLKLAGAVSTGAGEGERR